MCLICVDFQKQRMTIAEARRAYGEMVTAMDEEHARDVRKMLDDAEREARAAAARPAPAAQPQTDVD